MDLKEFVKTAISDITEAVKELQSDLTNGAIVNPTLPNIIATKTLVVDGEIRPIEHLAFDVAVSAAESSGIDGSAKAGIKIFGAKFGTESSTEQKMFQDSHFLYRLYFRQLTLKLRKKS